MLRAGTLVRHDAAAMPRMHQGDSAGPRSDVMAAE